MTNNIMKAFTSLLIFLSLSACGPGQDESHLPVTAEEVIQNYINAIGGMRAIQDIETMQVSALYEEPAYNLVTPSTVYKKRPDYRVVILPEIMIAEGYYDGRSWEYHGNNDEIIWTEGEAEKATRRGAEFDESVINWHEKGHAIELLGQAEVFDILTWHIKVTLSDGWVKHYYFDQATGLLVGRRKAMPIHAQGEDVETLSHIEDYRQVDGVRIPFVETEYRTDDRTMLNRLVKQDVVLNLALPDEIFTPEETRERLLEGR